MKCSGRVFKVRPRGSKLEVQVFPWTRAEALEMTCLLVVVWLFGLGVKGTGRDVGWACHKSCWSERLTGLGGPLIFNTQLPSGCHSCYLLWEHEKGFWEQHSQPLSWEFGCGSNPSLVGSSRPSKASSKVPVEDFHQAVSCSLGTPILWLW